MALNLNYVVRETGSNLRRNVGLTVASILTVVVSLVLVGTSFMIRQGADNANVKWKGGIELIIFMEPKIQPAQRDAIDASLNENPEVKDRKYVDQQAAYEEFKTLFKDSPEMVESVTPSILPPSYKVVPEHPEPGAITSLKEEYADDAGVKEVVSADDSIRTVESLNSFISAVVFFAAFVLAITAAVLIFNTIRMAMFARRREIEVMKLVGGTNWFIRIPFMIEGLVQGLVGSLLAVVSLRVLNEVFTDQLNKEGIVLLKSFAVDNSDLTGISIVLVVVGVGVGVIFSGIAASLYLDV
ncbi:MAG: permease-like cell division protein FtsX [Acidimicrobiales bacterium]